MLRCGNLVIDLSSHQVFLQDKEILLPNKEFELLAFLAKNPGIVFSKDTLFERVWGEDSLGDTSTVSVHINRIREKIEEDSSKPYYIENGLGCRLPFSPVMTKEPPAHAAAQGFFVIRKGKC